MSVDDPRFSRWRIARHHGPVALEAPASLPAADDANWRPLGRHLGPRDPAGATFNPGVARFTWTPAALVVDFAFAAARASNAARRLNEPTHQLGDVGELFLGQAEADRYIEIHVTPENQRLQLAWTNAQLEAVRAGRAELMHAAVADATWVQSNARVGAGFWSARLVVPTTVWSTPGARLAAGQRLRAAVCRYDYSGGTTPVLSSTANFRGAPFHDRAAWPELELVDG